jgi:hypothetical protein
MISTKRFSPIRLFAFLALQIFCVSAAVHAGPLFQAFRNFSTWQTLQADIALEYSYQGKLNRRDNWRLYCDTAGRVALESGDGQAGQWVLGDRLVLKAEGKIAMDKNLGAGALQMALHELLGMNQAFADRAVVEKEAGDQLWLKGGRGPAAVTLALTLDPSGRILSGKAGRLQFIDFQYAVAGSTQVLTMFTVIKPDRSMLDDDGNTIVVHPSLRVVLSNIVTDQAIAEDIFAPQ